VANAALTFLTPSDTFGIYNSSGSTHVIADVLGTWNLYPGSQAGPSAATHKDVQLRHTVSRD